MSNGIRTRENVATMGRNHPTLAAYRAAVRQMKNLPQSDPRNWERQAQIHLGLTGPLDPAGCPHGNWYFLPWHRKYILDFEEICRDLSGDPNFALPYWDWTQNPSIPGPFWRGTLLDTREVDRDDIIPAQFVGQPIIDDIMRQTDFELFASSRPFGQNNTDRRWQRATGGQALLERTPHNNVHDWIGGNMQTFSSPLDPIFWLHHCNIDRLWAEWNAPPRSRPNTSSALWTNFTLLPFNTLVGTLQSITQLGYTYDTLAQPQLAVVSPLPPLLERARERFELMEPQVASLEQAVSFPVQTPQSALPLAAEAVSAEAVSAQDAAEDGAPKVVTFVRGVEPPEDRRLTVNVFLNCPYLSAETPVSDPHYVGNFAFFGVHEHEDEEAEGEHDMKMSFVFDLSYTVNRLRALESGLDSQLTVQLMPKPYEGRNVQSQEIRIEGVQIYYT
jgi:tyrosinase